MAHGQAPRKLGGMVGRPGIGPLATGLVVVLFGLGAVPEPRRFEYVETHMGSPFKIILYTDDAALANRASRAAFDRIKALDLAFSDYNAESELSKLSDASGGQAVKVSDDLFDILVRSKRLAERSAGAFDPTVGPVGRLWRRARREKKLPAPDLLAKARGVVGFDRISLDPRAKTVRLASPGMKLDLGGIAKGYASQAAIDVLKREGIRSALVGGAGDIVASDPPPGQEGWSVAVGALEDPGASPPERYLKLKNAAVSTSGDAERFVEIDGVRYSHILDPRTGIGLTGRLSVTVISGDGAMSDALATAVAVLGEKRGLVLVEETPGASCLIVKGTGEGRKRVTSTRFPKSTSK